MKLDRMMLMGMTGLWFLMSAPAHAFYNPTTGRWLSRDPITEEGGPNLTGFVRNDAVNKHDLLGLQITPGITNIALEFKPKVKSCNVVVYLGHNGTVPQGTIQNEICSAAAVEASGRPSLAFPPLPFREPRLPPPAPA